VTTSEDEPRLEHNALIQNMIPELHVNESNDVVIPLGPFEKLEMRCLRGRMHRCSLEIMFRLAPTSDRSKN